MTRGESAHWHPTRAASGCRGQHLLELKENHHSVTSQFQPAFKSYPERPYPLFDGFGGSRHSACRRLPCRANRRKVRLVLIRNTGHNHRPGSEVRLSRGIAPVRGRGTLLQMWRRSNGSFRYCRTCSLDFDGQRPDGGRLGTPTPKDVEAPAEGGKVLRLTKTTNAGGTASIGKTETRTFRVPPDASVEAIVVLPPGSSENQVVGSPAAKVEPIPGATRQVTAPAAAASTSACPFLGLVDDSTTQFMFAAPGHRCHASGLRKRITLAHQESFCLSVDYELCPRYPEGMRRPPVSLGISTGVTGDPRGHRADFAQRLQRVRAFARGPQAPPAVTRPVPVPYNVSGTYRRRRRLRRLTVIALVLVAILTAVWLLDSGTSLMPLDAASPTATQ